MAVDLRQLLSEVSDRLDTAKIAVPANDRIVRSMNRAKDKFVRRIELDDPTFFLTSKTYSVTKNDPSIALPTSPDPEFRKLVSLQRTDLSVTVDAVIISPRERELHQNTSLSVWIASGIEVIRPVLFPVGQSLFFAQNSGAPADMTLVMHYTHRVPDLSLGSPTGSFTGIPDEMLGLLVDMTTLELVPPATPDWQRIKQDVEEQFVALGRLPRMDNTVRSIGIPI